VSFSQLHETGCTLGNKSGTASDKKYKTLLVHREYGINEMPHSRADLVIFNEKDVNKIDDPINLKSNGVYLDPDFIIEFGTEKSASSIAKLEEHLDKDLEKIAKAKTMGFLIHIQRNYLKGRDSNANQNKHNSYSELFNNKTISISDSKLKVLYFMVDIGGGSRQIYKKGKVKLFKEGKLQGINQNKLEEQIRSYLDKDG
jgi:hypothetical protein